MTNFDFIIQDSLTGDELMLDEFALNLYDLDVNKQQNLNERVCVSLHEFYPEHSVMPEGDVKATQSDDKDCNGKPHPDGSLTLESEGVGFLCDNPGSPGDLAPVTCADCFGEGRCKQTKFNMFFPIKRDQRVATFAFKSTSKFTVSLGLHCKKSAGETCNRNFLFSGSFE
jgi:hypothetical protein